MRDSGVGGLRRLNAHAVAEGQRASHFRFALTLVAFSATIAAAQAPPDSIRSQVEGARLGAGYAQIINLSAAPDLSAASYTIGNEQPKLKLDVIRLPYQARWVAMSPDTDLYWKLAGGYLQLKQDLPLISSSPEFGGVDSRWSAYSVSGGLLARMRLGNGFALEPALDVGIARLDNRASYNGAASALESLLNGLLFNWHTNAWLTTPSLGLAWSAGDSDGKATVRGHVARSWISTFGATDPVQEFNETANTYSVRAEYARPGEWQAFDRPLGWVVYGSYAGFFGANRDALGFTTVAELGAGLELPMSSARAKPERLRLSAGYLFGPNVRGWSIGLSIQY
jgi:hypothetical protein